MLIESINTSDPLDSKGIVWMSNPLEILLVFGMAIVGMFAFSSLLQGYYVTKLRIWERALLIPVVPLALVPNICVKFGLMPNEYTAYIVAAALYGFIFMTQWGIKDKPLDQIRAI